MITTDSFNDRRGENVLIKGKHPHAGEKGIYRGAQPSYIGWILLVELASGECCYVYDPANIKFLNKES